MAWPAQLVLVRHAESEGNVLSAEERAQYDVSTHEYRLTPRGREQARITGAFLREMYGPFDVRYVSYYTRSKETMAIMYPGTSSVYEDPRLAEAQRGIWHTMTKDQIDRNFPHESARKEREGLYHYRPLGGENWPDIELRIHSFLGTLSRDYAGKNVLMVVHAHWQILFQRLVHRLSIEEALTQYKAGVIQNASVTVYGDGIAKGSPGRLQCISENVVPWRGIC